MKRYQTATLATSVFIASEAIFFAFLIAAYIYFSGAVVHGPSARNSLDPPRTLLFTICLVASSGTLWFGERRLTAGDRAGYRMWLGATIVLGAVFITGQALEYAGLIGKSITPARNLFGATFFTLTGFHGFHVVCGLIALSVLLGLGPSKAAPGLGAVSLYWHFVDLVWIVIFSLVYLAVWL
jgi:heme/copper-type cytochrome/quinol oxidase subunit 3